MQDVWFWIPVAEQHANFLRYAPDDAVVLVPCAPRRCWKRDDFLRALDPVPVLYEKVRSVCCGGVNEHSD
jgi:hypothetical protein